MGFAGHKAGVSMAAFSPAGSTVLTASQDGIARLFALETGECTRNLEGHAGRLYSATFSADGRHVLTASSDKTCRLFAADTGKCQRIFEGHGDSIYAAIFSPDAQRVLTACGDGLVRIFDNSTTTGACERTLEGSTSTAVHTVACSPGGKLILLATDDRCVKVFAFDTGECIQAFDGHGDHVYGATFAADGCRVLTASDDCTAKVFALAAGDH